MSNNIEEDIKIVEELLKEYDLLDYRFGQMLNFEQTNAIENILDLIKGKTIHLSDEEYRQVIENAQKEINNRYMFEKTAKEEVEELLENSISKDKVKEKKEIAQKEYQKILNSIDRKISHTKDEHKIRSIYADFGVKRGRLEMLQELLEDKQCLN